MNNPRVWGSIVLGALIVFFFGEFAFIDKLETWLETEGKIQKWLNVIIALIVLAACLYLFKFTTTRAGRAKIVLCLGAYAKTIVSREGYKVASNGDIVALAPGEKPSFALPGGLRFVGIRWIHSLHTHDSEWLVIKQEGEGYRTESMGVKGVDETLVVDQVEGLRISQAEDQDELPLNILLSVTIEKVNPKKALLEVANWREALHKRIAPYGTRFVAKKTYEELDELDLENDLLTALSVGGASSVISEFLNRYGIKIRKIEVLDIDPPEGYRKMTLQRKIGEMNAKQAIEETSVRKFEGTAIELGITADELREKLKNEPGFINDPAYISARDKSHDIVIRDRAAEKGDLTDIRVGGTHGEQLPEGALIGGLAAIFQQKRKSERGNSGKGGGAGGGGNSGGSDQGGGRRSKTPTVEAIKRKEKKTKKMTKTMMILMKDGK